MNRQVRNLTLTNKGGGVNELLGNYYSGDRFSLILNDDQVKLLCELAFNIWKNLK